MSKTSQFELFDLHQLYKNEFKSVINRTKDPNLLANRKNQNFKKFWLTFLEQSGVHGLQYLAKIKLHSFERYFFWLLLLSASIFSCIYFGFRSFDRYKYASTVVSLEKDFFFWRTTTPSITICPFNRLNKTLFEMYTVSNNISDENEKENLFQFLESLSNSTYSNFKDIKVFSGLEKYKIDPNTYLELIYNLTGDHRFHADENQRIHTISVNSHELHTRQILTEFGLCYVTNNLLANNLSSATLIFGKEPLKSGDELTTYLTSEESLLKSDVTQGDIQYGLVGFSMDFVAIFVHSPLDIMSINTNYFLGTKTPIEFQAQTLEILTEDDFEKKTSISQRKCRFPHESNLTHFKVYTKNICFQECRIEAAYILCKCIPHFYPNPAKLKRVCNYTELMICFPKYANEFINLKFENVIELKNFQCSCVQNCRETRVLLTKTTLNKGVDQLFVGKGAIVTIAKYANTRYMRQVIFTFEDLLISIGGTAGFFLGVSVLSTIEIIYFFTLRLFWYLKDYK